MELQEYAGKFIQLNGKTSRDRPKTAPYPRLKNSKKTSKCQVFSFTVLENRKFSKKIFSKKLHTQKNGPSGASGPASASPWRAKRGTLPKLSTFLSQLKGGPFGEKTNFRKKISQCRKTERGDPLGFFNIHSVAKHQKTGKNFYFRKKNLTVPKKTVRGDPLVSLGMVCYAEKQENNFWFSSLGQIVQFGAIIFCRTFKNYFGQFVWIEKKSHYNSRVSLHEAPTEKEKNQENFSMKMFQYSMWTRDGLSWLL